MNRTSRRGHRPRHVPPLKKRCVNLTEEQVKLLRVWGRGDVSAGLRWLITAAAPLIVKVETRLQQSSAPCSSPHTSHDET